MPLVQVPFRSSVREAVFAQRPVFWRLNTLRKCWFTVGLDVRREHVKRMKP